MCSFYKASEDLLRIFLPFFYDALVQLACDTTDMRVSIVVATIAAALEKYRLRFCVGTKTKVAFFHY